MCPRGRGRETERRETCLNMSSRTWFKHGRNFVSYIIPFNVAVIFVSYSLCIRVANSQTINNIMFNDEIRIVNKRFRFKTIFFILLLLLLLLLSIKCRHIFIKQYISNKTFFIYLTIHFRHCQELNELDWIY